MKMKWYEKAFLWSALLYLVFQISRIFIEYPFKPF